MLTCFFILIVFLWSIKVNNMLDVFEFRLMSISCLKDYHDVELSNMEEMDK
jgi:hypothetical protein